MIIGAWKAATIAESTQVSSEVDLGRPYETLLISFPDLTNDTKITVKVAEQTGDTAYELHSFDYATGQNKVIDVRSGDLAQFFVQVPIGGFQYITLYADTAAPSGGWAIRVCGTRS